MSSAYDFSTSDVNADIGFGLRLDLPIGPIRVDYGYPVMHDGWNGPPGKFNLQYRLPILNDSGFERWSNLKLYGRTSLLLTNIPKSCANSSVSSILARHRPLCRQPPPKPRLNLASVDMNTVFHVYYKTKDAEAKINEARAGAKKEPRRAPRDAQEVHGRNQQDSTRRSKSLS